ncbi:unconventional myosin-IXa-like [Pollicipes pollicipes]|uniref:unconventional myosin-IXa-like n=1 Tax=Pollicipes pollicipes TaxID=41117 RepID=UPI001884C3D0|nr:unconventional myosin-IXa-like [Pollicipes pollicipes]
MASWTERIHRRAATLGTVVTACRLPLGPYPRRLEKVKFGFPLEQVCKSNIPGPLLVLILKLNKEAPFRKDVFRAPGHQNNIKKLVHFLQNGRLVNLDSFSIHTIASVLKKFLRMIPEGIFGLENEHRLFEIVQLDDPEAQRERTHRLILSLPPHTQHLLVLLFGTFRVIATHAERARTGMTSEALGVSAAPSFFQSCVTGRDARHEDVLRFKVAMRVMEVPDRQLRPLSTQGACRSSPARLHMESGASPRPSAPAPLAVPENTLGSSCPRLSSGGGGAGGRPMDAETSGSDGRPGAERASPNSSCLPMVHERQTERMRTRTEWFLTPVDLYGPAGDGVTPTAGDDVMSTAGGRTSVVARTLCVSSGDGDRRLVRRSSSKDKEWRLVRRSASMERRLVRRSSSKEQERRELTTVAGAYRPRL